MKSNLHEADGIGAAEMVGDSVAPEVGGKNSRPSAKNAVSATGKSTRPVGKRSKPSDVGGSVDCIDMLWSALQYCLRDGYAVRMANQDGAPGVVIAIDGFVSCDKDADGNSRLIPL